MAQWCRSAKEKKFLCRGDAKEDTLFPGWRGGSGDEGAEEYEVEVAESSLVKLELLSELLNATARAKALLLKLIVLFEIPPLLLLKGKFLFLSQPWLKASKFRRLLEYAFSGFTMSFTDGVVTTSARLVKDLDFPL